MPSGHILSNPRSPPEATPSTLQELPAPTATLPVLRSMSASGESLDHFRGSQQPPATAACCFRSANPDCASIPVHLSHQTVRPTRHGLPKIHSQTLDSHNSCQSPDSQLPPKPQKRCTWGNCGSEAYYHHDNTITTSISTPPVLYPFSGLRNCSALSPNERRAETVVPVEEGLPASFTRERTPAQGYEESESTACKCLQNRQRLQRSDS